MFTAHGLLFNSIRKYGLTEVHEAWIFELRATFWRRLNLSLATNIWCRRLYLEVLDLCLQFLIFVLLLDQSCFKGLNLRVLLLNLLFKRIWLVHLLSSFHLLQIWIVSTFDLKEKTTKVFVLPNYLIKSVSNLNETLFFICGFFQLILKFLFEHYGFLSDISLKVFLTVLLI